MSVASKNLFDLLGNDDGDETPQGPVKTVDKTSTRTTKRNVEPVAPSKPVGASSGARRGPGGNEGAFRDKNAGHSANQRRTTEEAPRGGPRGGRGARERGGRGGRFPRERDDRHSRGLPGSEKQAAQSWGATEGNAEQKDEQAGEAIAQTELKEATAEDAQNAEDAEAENKNISYVDYLAQQAEKKAALAGDLAIRKANEGSKVDKKWAAAKELVKEEDDFIAAAGGKAQRQRERKQKEYIDIDQRFVEQDRPRGGARGGRGGPAGGRGAPRGGAPRGEARGGRGQPAAAAQSGPRGGRGGNSGAAINTSDESAFPTLGK